MDKNRVLEALKTLQAELADSSSVDPGRRAALEQIAADVKRLVEGNESLAGDDQASVSGRLQDALLEFEAEHPQITGAMNQVAAALANLGI